MRRFFIFDSIKVAFKNKNSQFQGVFLHIYFIHQAYPTLSANINLFTYSFFSMSVFYNVENKKCYEYYEWRCTILD